MLPGTPYVDAEDSLTQAEIVEKIVVFEDVYPRMRLHVTDVDVLEKSVQDQDGGTHIEYFYRIKDNSFRFSDDWRTDGKELHVVFESGLLNGMDFEAHFNPMSVPEKVNGEWNPDAQWIEITVNETYGRRLPDTILRPSSETDNKEEDEPKGDRFFLYGWDSSKIDETGLVEAAEQELLRKTLKYLSESKIDPSTYNCGMMSDFMRSECETSSGQFAFPYHIGKRVRLHSEAYFPKTGYRDSRIMGFEYPLDIPYDNASLTIGDKPSYSRFGELKDTVENLSVRFDSLSFQGTSAGGASVYLIKTGDPTPALETNAFSALRANKRFLSKESGDSTPYGLSIGGRLTAKDMVGSETFIGGIAGGTGWQIDNRNGLWGMEADWLTLRRFLEVPELRYNRTEVIVGNTWQAPGAGIVESYTHLRTSKADDNGDGEESNCNIGVLTLKLEDGELGSLSEGDLCMGIWHFGTGTDGRTSDEKADSDDGKGTFKFAGFTTVYFIVYKVEGKHRETLHVRTREKWDAEPAVGMHFVAFGNRKWNYNKNRWEYPDRQKSAYRTRTYERFLVNVNDWTFGEDNIAMQFGDLTNLTIDGTNMAGYSAYLNNIYMAGVIRQLDAKLRLEIRTSGDHYVADGDSCLAMIYAFHGANDVSTETEQNKLLLTAKRKGDGLMVPITSSENGNFMTLDKSLLGTSDSATVTVTATYTDYKGKTYTASADIVIYDRALLKGDKGDKGVGWQKDVTDYAKSTSGTTAPTSGWQSAIPAVPEGQYLWTRVTTHYTDGSHTTAYSVSRMGKNGESLTISSAQTRYAKSTTATRPADTAFTASDVNNVTLSPGDYLWCRIVVTYSDGTQTKSYSVSRIGSDGDTGNSLHIAYAKEVTLDSTTGKATAATGFSTTPFDGYGWIGTYADTSGYKPDSTDFKDYAWTRAKGDTGSSYTENLLTGTRGFTAPWTIGSGSAANGSYEGLTIVECDLTATGAAAYADLAFRDYAFTDGETYTLSFWARTGVSGTRSYVHVPVPGVVIASDGQPNTAVTTTTWHMFELGATAPWRRYRITFKAATVPFAAAHNVLFRLYGGNGGNGGNAVQLAGVKLERGENAHTEWSPATEEMLGKDAVNIIVSPSSLVVNNNQRHAIRTTKVYVDLYDGDRQVNYSSGTDSDDVFKCGLLTESTSTPIDPEGNVEWRFGTDNSTGVNRFFYYFHIAKGTVIDRTIPFTVTYKGRTYQSQLGLKTVSDGEDGQDGKDAVTYDWLVSPDIIHCDYYGYARDQKIKVKCFRVVGSTRTEVTTGIEWQIPSADGGEFRKLTNGTISLIKSNLNQDPKPTIELQLVDSAGAVLTRHDIGYICDGLDGGIGPQGAVMNLYGEFVSGAFYRDGRDAQSEDSNGVRWYDVVWVKDAAGTRHYKRCVKSRTYSTLSANEESEDGWEPFSQFVNIMADLVMADKGFIEFLTTREIQFAQDDKLYGRIGVPYGDVVMYAGEPAPGENSVIVDTASYVLTKTGYSRFGTINDGNPYITLNPSSRAITVFNGNHKELVTIDGKPHDINGLYGCKFNIPKNFAPGYVTEGKSYTIGEFEVGDEGAAFHASIAAHLHTETNFVPGYGETSSPTYIGIFAESYCEAHLKLARVDDSREIDSGNASLDAPSHDGMMTSIRPVTKLNNEDFTLTINAPNLTKGTYRLTLSVGITNGETTKDTRKAVATASVTLGMLSRTFKTGNSPRALLCANGLIVANSTQDYLVAGMSGGTFNVEAHAGERGIRLDKSGVVMQDDNGAWTQGIVEHCTQRALNIGACVGKTQGVRHWMIDDKTTGQPAGASLWGALTTYTIDNGGKNHIQEYRSFDSPMQLWTRKCPRSTTDSRWTEWYRQF